MYCQQPEYYQMPTDYQAYVGSGLPYQGINMPNYPPSDISLYSPNSPADRPSPSFRIEDIIHNNKTCSGNPYANMYPSNHYPPFAADSLQHGGVLNKDYQGMSTGSINSFPAYFRLKSNPRMVGGRKCRKPRTVFSELQLMILEREFAERKYLSTPQRTKLAERLGLNQTQVKTWYQNRRMKWKKETNESDTKKLKQMNSNVDDSNENTPASVPSLNTTASNFMMDATS